MPPVVAVFATIGLAISGSAVMGTAAAVMIGVMTVMSVVSIGYAAYMMATLPDVSGFSSETRGRTQVVRSAVTPHRVIYGEVMVSGPLVAAFSSGENNKFIYLVIVLASHEVWEIGDVYFGDKLSTDPQFYLPDPLAEVGHGETWIIDIPADPPVEEVGHWEITSDPESYLYRWVIDTPADPEHTRPAYQITKYLGTLTQTADADLIADARDVDDNPCWTAAHKLTGRAYIVVKLEYDTTVFPQGIPNIKAVVKGSRSIYDPRTTATGYSTNWANCCRDYLVKSYGLKCVAGDIDEASFIAAANICDEWVLTQIGSERRYAMNGSFSLDGKPVDIMRKLLTGAVGQLVWSQGRYSIFPAAYNIPVSRPLTESDLRGSISVMPAPSRKNKINTVRGTFVNPLQSWQQTDFPVVQLSAALALDAEELVDNIELPYTTSGETAHRLATIHLNRGLLGITVTFPGKLTCFRYQPQDVVPVTIAQLGWVNKLFRVTNWGLSDDGGVDLTLREESPDVYGWTSAQGTLYTYPPVAKIDWPPRLALSTPTGVTATPGALQITVGWVAVAGATSYNVYWSATAGVTKANGTKVQGLFSPYVKTGLAAGTAYYFIVTSFNGIKESADSAQVSATTNA